MKEELTDISVLSKKNEGINTLEKFMLTEMEIVNEKLTHIFTPGLYAREFSAQANTLWISREHKTEHIFSVSKGAVSVWIDGVETLIVAPYTGITKAGTRRILFVWEDLIWTTFHANPLNKNEDEIVEEITEVHHNELLDEELMQRLKFVRQDIQTKYLTT